MLIVRSRAYRQALGVLAFSAFLIFANLYSVQPLLSLFSQQFQASATTVNWIFAGAALGMSCSLILWALLGDAFGRQRIMRISLGLVACIGFRVLQGIALAGLPAVAVAYITEEFESASVMGVVGIYIAFTSIGGIGGRLLSAFISEHWGANSAMLFFAVLSVAGSVLIYAYLPKEAHFSAQPLKGGQILHNLCGHMRNLLLWRAFLISALCVGMFINLFSVISLRLGQAPWQFDTFQISLLFLCYLGGTFAAGTIGRLTRRLRPIQAMFLGWLVFVIGILCCAVSELSIMVIGLLIASVGFFSLHALASAWVGRSAENARALATALYLSAYYLGSSLGGFYLIPLYQHYDWHWVVLGAEAVLLFVPLLIYGLGKHHRA